MQPLYISPYNNMATRSTTLDLFLFSMNDNHHHLELTTMILLYALAYGKVMKVAALFYLSFVVYDLTICSQFNGIKMIKYRLFYLWRLND